jgi:murein DD-endopeptidase MepM/ murein hydrolase activator NlpD
VLGWLLIVGCRPTPPPFALGLPLACEPGRTCFVQNYFDHDPSPAAVDFACRSRTYDGHDGTDLRVVNVAAMRAGVHVIASAPGTVRAVRDGEPERMLADGESAPTGRECGNGVVLDHGGGWETQVCHLARGSVVVAVGDTVSTGTKLGRVGLSGQTQFPHVHLAVRRDGVELDPFAVDALAGACRGGGSLWSPGVAAALADPPAVVLDAGFAAGPVTLDEAELGEVPQPTLGGDAIVAWARAMGLDAGDVVTIRLVDPDGNEVSTNEAPPLARAKARHVLFTGKRMRGGGLRSGTWRLRYTVTRGGVVVLEREASLEL